ncbi:not available [Pontoporia blainvillei]|uniref:Not available n=1 Tax=Pontoporia blainvillei TaxID=48723 RepID=A0ABX0S8N4_PONBL|nr:not available [Pontoporia blainvillei]
MKLNLHPRRCHHGRKGRMAPSSQQEAAEQGEVVMNMPHMEGEEVTNKEGGGVDVVATTTVAEGEEEEISIKEAGQMEGVEGAVATKMVVTEILVSSRVAITVATVVATRVVVMVASKHLHIQEVDTRVVDISRTVDTKMEGIMVIEAVAAEGEVVAEAEVVDAQAREEVGEEEGARIITRGDSLNSTSSMEVISIIILDLDRADIILVEATEPYILLELK